MADHNVIADVSNTLVQLVTNGLAVLPGAPVAELNDLDPRPTTNPARVTIFLFEVIEDASLRNRPRVQQYQPPVGIQVSKPAMTLLLRYLITPWSDDPATDHQMLGRTLQHLYDNAIVSGPQLTGGLVGSDLALKLKLAPLTLEERSRIFYAIQQPYRLSVSYDVRVVPVDTTVSAGRRPVTSRTITSGVPAVVP